MFLPSVIAITPGDGRDLSPWLQTLGQAGLPAVVVREPTATPGQVARWVETARRWIPVVWLHRKSPSTAELLSRVAGEHVPAGALGSSSRPWGRSCHSVPDVREALAAGASWAFLSPIHDPSSKPEDRRPTLGLSPLRDLSGDPVYALGGMTPERHRDAMRAGAAGSAVLGDLFHRPLPVAAERLEDWLRT